MPLTTVLIVLVIAGFVLYLLTLPQVPIAAPVKTLITAVVILVLVLWILSLFGVGNITVGSPPRVR